MLVGLNNGFETVDDQVKIEVIFGQFRYSLAVFMRYVEII